jgi:hypothetical protein
MSWFIRMCCNKAKIHNAERSGATVFVYELSVITVKGKNDALFPHCKVKYNAVACAGNIFHNGQNIMSYCTKKANAWQRKIFIGKKVHRAL